MPAFKANPAAHQRALWLTKAPVKSAAVKAPAPVYETAEAKAYLANLEALGHKIDARDRSNLRVGMVLHDMAVRRFAAALSRAGDPASIIRRVLADEGRPVRSLGSLPTHLRLRTCS